MAIFRFKIARRSRSQGSQSAANVVQYLTREGRYAVFPENDVRYMTRTNEETQGRGDLRHVEVGNLPAWANGDAGTFFEAAYQYEGVNRTYATALQMALPRELSHEQQIALTRDFIAAHLEGKPYLWVKHEPVAKDGGLQPHVHILLSERTQDGIGRPAAQFFRRYNRVQPDRGGTQKDPWWIERRAPSKLRESWAILTNIHLERTEIEVRVDPRELRTQGIERMPGTKWQRNPEPRDVGKEQAAASAWWEMTKEKLYADGRGGNCGNGYDLRKRTRVNEAVVIATIRTYARQGNPGHYPTRGEIEQALAHIQTQQQTLGAEQRILGRALDPPLPRPSHAVSRGHEERNGRGGLRITLDEERLYGREI